MKFEIMKFYYGKMEFEVPESVYYPREDSELLAKIIEKTDLKNKAVLEIGCGCGFLAILTAKAGANVTAVDINEGAVKVTGFNARANDIKLNVAVSDLFSSVSGRFDLIVFNPPYLPAEEADITYSGGKSGREIIERFVSGIRKRLKPTGIVLIVVSSLTGEYEVVELFKKQHMKAEVVARKKIPWEELIVIEARI